MRSLRKAINEKCRDCSYDRMDKGTWRQQVEDCRCPDCALYTVRPLPKVSKAGYKDYAELGKEIMENKW